MSNIFEEASKKSYRFIAEGGNLSVEDLWKINLNTLDKLAIDLNNQIKSYNEESFIKPKVAHPELDNKFEIVKYIIETRVETKENARKNAELNAEKDKLLSILNAKQDGAKADLPIEELIAMIDKLEIQLKP